MLPDAWYRIVVPKQSYSLQFLQETHSWKHCIAKNDSSWCQHNFISLRQEVVRRLANTSYNVGQSEKEEIVLKFAQKMVNSDFTQGEVIMTLVQGLTKFENMKWKEQLPVSHANHQPLHLSSIYNRHQRKVDKFLAESTLYLPSNGSDQTWRNKLQSCWKKISEAS